MIRNYILIFCFLSLHSTVFSFHSSSFPRLLIRRDIACPKLRNCPVTLSAHFISFDLDDTIFPVAPVMHDANNAMLKHLKSFGCATTQDDFQKTMRKIRSEMTKEGKVMRYTEIRLSAIRMEMEKYMDPSRICHKQILESYDVWEANRHIAAEKYLYSDTIPMLEEIKINHPGAIIAAITNGKGNPFEMKSICNYFDFCTSGEDKNVFPYRKPHKGIYKIALQRFEELSQRKGLHVGSKLCWIHIGDDLANDIGASARCGANPIWVDLGDDYGQTASKRSTIMAQPSWSTLTKDDLQKRKILDNEAKLLISKRVTKLSMLPTAIREISESLPQ